MKALQIHSNEREQFYSTEKIQYEKDLKEISKQPLMTSIQIQTVNYLIFVLIYSKSIVSFQRILLMMIEKVNNYKMNLMIIN